MIHVLSLLQLLETLHDDVTVDLSQTENPLRRFEKPCHPLNKMSCPLRLKIVWPLMRKARTAIVQTITAVSNSRRLPSMMKEESKEKGNSATHRGINYSLFLCLVEATVHSNWWQAIENVGRLWAQVYFHRGFFLFYFAGTKLILQYSEWMYQQGPRGVVVITSLSLVQEMQLIFLVDGLKKGGNQNGLSPFHQYTAAHKAIFFFIYIEISKGTNVPRLNIDRRTPIIFI